MVVVEGATVSIVSRRATMVVFSILLSLAGFGFLCWLLFTLAVYALPCFTGLMAGLAAYHSGAGVIGAIVVVVLTGAATLVVGQVAFATVRSPPVRAGITLLFAAPAAVTGYYAVLDLAQIGVPSGAWRELLAVIGAILVGSTAWTRMALLAPRKDRADVTVRSVHRSLTIGTRKG
jgi:hypothetical protein